MEIVLYEPEIPGNTGNIARFMRRQSHDLAPYQTAWLFHR